MEARERASGATQRILDDLAVTTAWRIQGDGVNLSSQA